MKLNRLKKLPVIAVITGVCAFPLFTFEWPQENVSAEKFFSFFGQKRESTISNSLIFSESETAKSTDSGQVTTIITEHEDGFNWFESTLGTAVIVSHEDSLMTVYANLDTDELNPELLKNPEVIAGTELSTTGNSAWTESQSFLEFQIVDTKNKKYVNPLILMPRIGKEETLTLTGISLQNKFGKIYELDTQKNIPAGFYKVFRKRQSKAVPYKTSVLVNGAESERLSFDTLKQEENQLAVESQSYYIASELYPDDDKMLMGEIYLPHGKDTISLIITDFSGSEKSRIYNVTVY